MLPIKVARPYFEDTLARQFSRLRKAGVTTMTYVETHKDLLKLVLPPDALEDVIKAGGDWGKCGTAVSKLLDGSLLGKTIFHAAGAFALSADFQKDLDKILAQLETKGISAETITEAKVQLAEATDSFKDTVYLMYVMSCHVCHDMTHYVMPCHVMYVVMLCMSCYV